MKAYKTWEAMKMLSENPKLKFQYKYDKNTTLTMSIGGHGFLELINSLGANGLNENVKTDDEWTLVQEPVPFMEAVKAFNNGKTIRCERSSDISHYKGGFDMVDQDDIAVSANEILVGKWFIEEDSDNE